MGSIRLYPSVKVTGKSFKSVKRCVIPNQSLSLREIVKRFVRRESIPISKEGLYEERFGDIEKLAKADIVEQMERVEVLKKQIAEFNKRVKKREEDLKAQAAAAKAPITTPTEVTSPDGVTPVKTPPL